MIAFERAVAAAHSGSVKKKDTKNVLFSIEI
jgi:hypothetical protein